MILSELLPEEASRDPRLAAVAVTGLTANSRKVGHGFAFFAVPGSKADGLQFVPQAIANGAAVIVAERTSSAPADGVAFVRVANVRRALALAAARFFVRQPATIAAITGTSGKTSVAAFTRQIWQALGHASASVGTIGVVSPRGETYGSLTTPDPVDLHRTLAALADEGVTHLAMEASSHGLDQYRLDGVRVSAGAFTNLSRDHLDYHPTLDAYLQAKLRLFSDLVPPGGGAVIVADHEPAARVVAAAKARGLAVFTVGRQGEGIRLAEAGIEGFAQRLTLEHAGRRYAVKLPLVGTFQVENALVAAGLAIVTGGDAPSVFAALEGLRGARGRLDLVGEKNGAPIFVDYAHKPDALAKTLEALRPFASARLVVVFGAGGDRDPGKRVLMGEAAAAGADRVIVTDDNPRSEDPAAIRAAILAAAPGAIEIGDRAQAIRQAIADLRRGDVLVIAGKGHESGQIVGEQVLPFSDHEEVAAALGEGAR
ncbi:MAG: UDP-N-acetylmuramoyl-L-alanyl-D-glutamate--2,6-diaminopimelate ligase [Pseudorhodoplanes sp.]|nr:UDP-N-acetylmuramoyl-L-alanyl-D-glutamate--2,6-diaminopimelate ligase [Pseudorhodoplanes sp.]GIK81478.1 MAG: UDP-N-acetylmuramoyl-L-alanyl-D-glutamate--2,6-diaminopimelate ligase [Alphaproteobacteria bacterium]